jgi:hypothetical protein
MTAMDAEAFGPTIQHPGPTWAMTDSAVHADNLRASAPDYLRCIELIEDDGPPGSPLISFSAARSEPYPIPIRTSGDF